MPPRPDRSFFRRWFWIGTLLSVGVLAGPIPQAASEAFADPQDPPAAAPQAKPGPQDQPRDVTDIDLDDLLKVHVTSPAKKEQQLRDVPAAIYVIRDEDLERSGVTTIADALRAVPGVQVARSNSNTWSISARGFNDSSNKLLVLIDGRSVYSPIHSGVFWDVQDTLLQDIDRIEVIRGPGGTIWGSNAVNGVVNVITKPAESTQGGLAYAGGGTEERGFGGARYGFEAAEDLRVRVWAKYSNRADQESGVGDGTEARDAWSIARGGFRADWKADARDRFTFMGDFYDGQEQLVATTSSLTAPFFLSNKDRMDVRGGDFIFRWDRQFSPASNLSLQLYYDYAFRAESLFALAVNTEDLDLQYRFSPVEGHDVNCGLGYRSYETSSGQSFELQFTPARRTEDIASAFLQDEITLVKDHLRVILGSKFEYNTLSGFEYEPSGRIAWTIDERQMAWGAISRAVRTPSILDTDIRLNQLVNPGPPPTEISVFGDRNFRSEDLLAYEAGYRIRPLDPVFLDLALFYNRYVHLRSIEQGAGFTENNPAPSHTVLPFDIANNFTGQSGGVELASNVQLAAWWLLQANYAYLREDLKPTNGSLDTTTKGSVKDNPHHQVWIRSAMDLPMNLTLDVMGRYVSELAAFPVRSYVETDVRIAWKDPTRRLEAALVGQNLDHDAHAEFGMPAQRSEIRRGGYASLTVRF